MWMVFKNYSLLDFGNYEYIFQYSLDICSTIAKGISTRTLAVTNTCSCEELSCPNKQELQNSAYLCVGFIVGNISIASWTATFRYTARLGYWRIGHLFLPLSVVHDTTAFELKRIINIEKKNQNSLNQNYIDKIKNGYTLTGKYNQHVLHQNLVTSPLCLVSLTYNITYIE